MLTDRGQVACEVDPLGQHFDRCAAGLGGARDERRQPAHVVRAKDYVHVREVGQQRLAVALSDATPDSDDHVRIVAGLGGLERRHVAAEALLGTLAHGTGVEDDDVGDLGGCRLYQSEVALKHAGYALGIVLVHLAAEGADEVRLHGRCTPRSRA